MAKKVFYSAAGITEYGYSILEIRLFNSMDRDDTSYDDSCKITFQAAADSKEWYSGKVVITAVHIEQIAKLARLAQRITGKETWGISFLDIADKLMKDGIPVSYDSRAGEWVTEENCQPRHFTRFVDDSEAMNKPWAAYEGWASDYAGGQKAVLQAALDAGNDEFIADFIAAGKPVLAVTQKAPNFYRIEEFMPAA